GAVGLAGASLVLDLSAARAVAGRAQPGAVPAHRSMGPDSTLRRHPDPAQRGHLPVHRATRATTALAAPPGPRETCNPLAGAAPATLGVTQKTPDSKLRPSFVVVDPGASGSDLKPTRPGLCGPAALGRFACSAQSLAPFSALPMTAP